MMKKQYHFIFYLSLLALCCCSPQKPEQTLEKKPDSQKVTQNSNPIKPNPLHVSIKSLNIIVLSDYPVEVNVAVLVELKNSCSSVDEIYQSRRGDTFLIEMLESQQKRQQCKPQSTLSEYIIPLDIRRLNAGHYIVYVNQEREHFELLVDN